MIPIPWLVGGAIGLSAAIFGFGYYKGAQAEIRDCLADKAEALTQQAEDLRQEHNKQLEALKRRAERRESAKSIADIPRPTTELCDATEWVQPITEAVRKANAAAQPD